MSISNINTFVFQKMNMRRTIGQRREGAAFGDNQVPTWAPLEGVAMPFNLARLTDAEVRTSPAYMAYTITMMAKAMTRQVNRKNVQRENPPFCSTTDRLTDFTRMNPHIFTGSKTLEDPHEFLD